MLIIDEAHHILMVRNPTDLEYQFEILKSLTIITGVTIVLVGTYKLLEIRDQSGQLVRRSQIIHFPRYDINDIKHREQFKSTLVSMANSMPISPSPNLAPHVDYFYLKTAGCVGILKEWLERCLEQVLDKKKPFTPKLASEFALSNKALMTVVEEALAGEAKLKDVSDAVLSKLLKDGIPMVPKKPKEPPSGGAAPKPTEPPKGGTAPKPKLRPGERSPTRDPVGDEYAEAA